MFGLSVTNHVLRINFLISYITIQSSKTRTGTVYPSIQSRLSAPWTFTDSVLHAEKTATKTGPIPKGRDISIEGYKKTGSRTHLNRIWQGHLRT